MKKYDWHSLDAFKNTLAYLNAHRSHWSANPHVAESVAYIEPLVQELVRRGTAQQNTQPEGYTNAKDASLDAMLALGWKLCKKLKVYALKSGNLVLQRELSFSKSTFDDGTEEEQAARCRLVAERASANAAALDTYQVRSADVERLLAAIDAFAPMETERDLVADSRKLLTASIGTLIRHARAKFKELDGEIDAFFDEEADEEFAAGYREARSVSKIRPRHAEVKPQGQ